MHSGLAAERALPPAVIDDLARVCALVAREARAWSVGGEAAGTTAPSLAEALYERWYTQPAAPPPAAAGDPPLHRASLRSALRAAHARSGERSDGWTAMSVSPRGAVLAAKGQSVRLLRPGDYRAVMRSGAPPAPGEPVEAVARLDDLDAERGIWWTFSDPGPEPPIGRLYLNARPATAPRVIHELTTALASAPHQVKCPVDARACRRVDAVVVYHPRGAREQVLAVVLHRWPPLGPLLDPAVPPLTCGVRPGLSWADDVGDQRSYGESRCHALAAAIDAAAGTWAASGPDQRLEVLLAGLRAAGADPVRPWEAAP